MSEVNKPVVHMPTGRPEAGRHYAQLYDAAQSELAALRGKLDEERLSCAALASGINLITLRLADAERRNAVMADLLRLIRGSHGTMLLTDPPQDPWKYHQIAAKIEAALQPTESGASE